MTDSADAPAGASPDQPILQVRHRDDGDGLAVVTLTGEIDLATAPQLKSRLTGLLAQGFGRFVLDLSGVRHMDSTGLGVMVGFRRRLPDNSLLVIAAATANVRAVIELTGLDFEMEETVEEAVAHLGRARDRRPTLSTDSAMVIGLASTALPFADSLVEEAERWLRILRLHGEAGRALTALGLSEAPLDEAAAPTPSSEAGGDAGDRIAGVIERARHAAAERRSGTVGTADLLRGVMGVYGADFEWVLRTRGSDPAEVLDQLGKASVTSAS